MTFEKNGIEYEKVRTLYRGETYYRTTKSVLVSDRCGNIPITRRTRKSIITDKPLRSWYEYQKEIEEQKEKQEKEIQKAKEKSKYMRRKEVNV